MTTVQIVTALAQLRPLNTGDNRFKSGGVQVHIVNWSVRNLLGLATALIVLGSGPRASAQNAERLLGRDVMASAKTMPKDVHIYHYVPVEKVWPELTTPEGRTKWIDRYLSDVTGRFWDLHYRVGAFINAGPGVYAAIDPYISSPATVDEPKQNFGTTMLEITIPRGTRYINVIKPVPIAKDTLDALVNEGIIARHQASFLFYKASGPTGLGFYRDTLKNMTDAGFENFRAMFSHILQSNGIQFIEYNWKTGLVGFCKTNTMYAPAFNYIGTNPSDHRYSTGVSMASAVLVYPGLSGAEQDLGARSQKLIDVLRQIANLRSRGIKVPATLVSSAYSPGEFKQIKDTTYTCD